MVTVSYAADTTIEIERLDDDGIVSKDFRFYVSGSILEVAIRYDIVGTLD